MIRRLYTPRYVYDTELDQQRAQGLQMLVIIFGVLLVVLALRLILAQAGAIQQTGALLPLEIGLLMTLGALAIGLTIIYTLIQRGQLDVASWVLVGLLVLGTLTPITTYTYGPIFLIIPLVTASVLLGRRGLLVTLVFLAGGILLRYSVLSLQDAPIRVIPSRDIGTQTIQSFNVLFLLFFLLYVFGGGALRIGREVARSFQRLQRVTRLTPQFAAETSEDVLMGHVLMAAQEGLGYALAQIFVVDGSGRVTRHIRRGTAQQPLLTTTEVSIGDASVVMETVQNREPEQVSEGDTELRSQHLVAPSRRSISLAILFSTGRVAAVLDVQSISPAAPRDSEMSVLRALAEQFAAAWEKLALTTDQTRVINDQAAQIERLREQVNTLEGRARQTVVQSWQGYLQGRGEDSIGFDLIRQQHGLSERDLRAASELPPELRQGLESGEPQITLEDDEQVIHVPIRIRNTMMGAMAFRVPNGQIITVRQVETVRIVAERLSLALESTRLYEQFQAQARRERKASEVTGVLLGTTDLNTLLNAAAGAFHEALGAVSTRVTIEPAALTLPAAAPNGTGNGNGASANGSQGGNR